MKLISKQMGVDLVARTTRRLPLTRGQTVSTMESEQASVDRVVLRTTVETSAAAFSYFDTNFVVQVCAVSFVSVFVSLL